MVPVRWPLLPLLSLRVPWLHVLRTPGALQDCGVSEEIRLHLSPTQNPAGRKDRRSLRKSVVFAKHRLEPEAAAMEEVGVVTAAVASLQEEISRSLP